jgi:hypothetical protein
MAWRRSYGPTCYCDDAVILSKKLIGDVTDITCLIGCASSLLKDIETNIPLEITTHCNSYSIEDDWSLGRKTSKIILPNDQNIVVGFKGTAWLKLENKAKESTKNLDSLGYEFRMKLDTTTRMDTGKINNSPVSLIPPIIRLRKGFKYDLKMGTSDEDNDDIRCRWSLFSKNECAGKNFPLFVECHL